MRIPMLREAFADSDLPLAPFNYDEIRLVSNESKWAGSITDLDPKNCFHFRPHFGWTGAIEWTGETGR